MRRSVLLGIFVLAIVLELSAADSGSKGHKSGCKGGKEDPCLELENVCDRISAAVTAFYSELFANESLGPRLDFDEVNWKAVKRLIADKFTWEDYSAFASAGIYKNIKTYWRAFTRATEPFPQIGLATPISATCDPFALHFAEQYLETFGTRDKCDSHRKDEREDKMRTETSTSMLLTEFVEECGELKVKKVAYWTSGNLFDLVRPKKHKCDHKHC